MAGTWYKDKFKVLENVIIFKVEVTTYLFKAITVDFNQSTALLNGRCLRVATINCR